MLILHKLQPNKLHLPNLHVFFEHLDQLSIHTPNATSTILTSSYNYLKGNLVINGKISKKASNWIFQLITRKRFIDTFSVLEKHCQMKESRLQKEREQSMITYRIRNIAIPYPRIMPKKCEFWYNFNTVLTGWLIDKTW